MSHKRFTRISKVPEKQPADVFEAVPSQDVVPYDESLLERARILWQFGDWSELASIERDALNHHPDRAKLALLAAAGLLQTGDTENARSFVRLAKDWGCSKRLISQILVAGVHNSLGRALSLTMNQGRAIQHFEKALEIGVSSSDSKLLSQARILQQLNENSQYSNLVPHGKIKPSLAELYKNHSGYVSDKWGLYLHVYESIFSCYRQRVISLLEIGIQNGGSLEIWQKYFENAKSIVGCDIDQMCGGLTFSSKKIKLAIGDVKSKETQDSIIAFSSQYDIVIDDGSHKSSDIINAFCSLFPRLSQGGIYVIEDLHCSYWNDWEGGLDEPSSSITFFKNLIDLVNYEHWGNEMTRSQWLLSKGYELIDDDTLAEIHSVNFYNSLCVVEKRKSTDNTLGVRHVVGLVENVTKAKGGDGTFSLRVGG